MRCRRPFFSRQIQAFQIAKNVQNHRISVVSIQFSYNFCFGYFFSVVCVRVREKNQCIACLMCFVKGDGTAIELSVMLLLTIFAN